MPVLSKNGTQPGGVPCLRWCCSCDSALNSPHHHKQFNLMDLNRLGRGYTRGITTKRKGTGPTSFGNPTQTISRIDLTVDNHVHQANNTELIHLLRRICPRISAITSSQTEQWADLEGSGTPTREKTSDILKTLRELRNLLTDELDQANCLL